MKFKVHGADADTGHDLAVELHAPTVASARAQAFRMGMLVSRVEVLEGPEVPAELGAPPPPESPDTRPPQYPAQPHDDRIVTTQRTSKKWKKVQLAGGIIFVSGFFFLLMSIGMRRSGDTAESDLASVVGSLGFFGGPCVWLYGRISAWWHHG